MKKTLYLTAALALGLFTATALQAKDNVDYVDPFIGTTDYSVCNPGAILPHGLMSVVPFNVMGSDLNQHDKDKGWWSTPYDFHNKYFTGFAHVTLSGVGCPEMGSLLLMPTTGQVDVDYHNYGSEYTAETARPGYYSNLLSKYGVRCEVSATQRTSSSASPSPRDRATCSSTWATDSPTRWAPWYTASATPR